MFLNAISAKTWNALPFHKNLKIFRMCLKRAYRSLSALINFTTENSILTYDVVANTFVDAERNRFLHFLEGMHFFLR